MRDRENWGVSERLILTLMAIWVARVTGSCDQPPQLENGDISDKFISLRNFSVGIKIAYKCHPGYVFQEGGSRHIICREDSTWSPLRAVCEPRNCGNPGDLSNGYYNASGTTFGMKVTFYCDKGYIMVGKPFRICTATGWDGQVPTCEIVTCPDPPPIANGIVSSPPGEFWTFGSVAKYSCIAGHSLIGKDTITCTATREWKEHPPKCQVVQCVCPELPANAYMESRYQPIYNYQDTIKYKCNNKFKMVGKSIIECKENNTFVPSPPTCEPYQCSKPPALKNGSPIEKHISQTVFPVDSRVTYECYPGYMFQAGGSRYITCRTDATWSPLRAVCERKYKMVGKATRTCTAAGWDGQIPTCEIVKCPDLPPIAYGTVSSPRGEFWKFGSVAKYSCLEGYFLIGEDTITCTATGHWNGDPPKCQARNCGNPGKIQNGYCKVSDPTLGGEVAFYCDKGYKMVGKAIRTCTATGWDGQVPICENESKSGSSRAGQQFELLLVVLGLALFMI